MQRTYESFNKNSNKNILDNALDDVLQEEKKKNIYADIIELGMLSQLRCLQSGDEKVQSTLNGDLEGEESQGVEREYWMTEGERRKVTTHSHAEQVAGVKLREEEIETAYTETLSMVQQLPSLGLHLSDRLASNLILSFLSLLSQHNLNASTHSLFILNALTERGGQAYDDVCELLAKRLLSEGKQKEARAVCGVLHRRSYLCDSSFYAFMFASMLTPAVDDVLLSASRMMREGGVDSSTVVTTVGVLSELSTSDGVSGKEEREGDIVNVEREEGRGEEEGGAVSPPVLNALYLLEEIRTAATTTTTASPAPSLTSSLSSSSSLLSSSSITPTFTPTPLSTSDLRSRHSQFRKVAGSLVEILIKLGYPQESVAAVTHLVEVLNV